MTAGRPPVRFETAREALRAAVAAGRFDASGMLPGERDLAAELGVSRATLRRVLADLGEDGTVSLRPGVGTFVGAAGGSQEPAITQPVGLVGFAETMRRRGLVPSTRDMAVALVEPQADEAMLLGCGAHESVVRVRRLRLADDDPVSLEQTTLRRTLWPEAGPFEGSLHDRLAALGVVPVRALQRVEAGLATVGEAQALALAASSAVMHLRRTEYQADGRCCLVTRATVRSDRFDLLMEFGSAPPQPGRS